MRVGKGIKDVTIAKKHSRKLDFQHTEQVALTPSVAKLLSTILTLRKFSCQK